MSFDQLLIVAQDINQAFDSLPKPAATPGRITTVISLILSAVGILAILFVVIGGIRYVASRGNPDQVAQAKNTIIYALVGLTICLFVYVIIQFTTGRLV